MFESINVCITKIEVDKITHSVEKYCLLKSLNSAILKQLIKIYKKCSKFLNPTNERLCL